MKIRDQIAFCRTALTLKLGFAGGNHGYKKLSPERLSEKLLSRCAILEIFIKNSELEKDFLKWCAENLEEERNG